jgi:hypothetical protein
MASPAVIPFEAAELLPDTLADRLQRLEAVARLRGVDADALAGAVIDGHEDTDLAFLGGDGGGHIGPPEFVPTVGDDGPVVCLGTVRMPDPLRGLEAMLPHQPPDPLLGGPDALVAEPGPDLAVALAVERRLGQDAADVVDQSLVVARPLGTTPLRFGVSLNRDRPGPSPMVERRAGQVPDPTDAGQTVGLASGGGDGLAYRLRLLGAKGRSARQRWSKSSLSIVCVLP